MKINNLSLILLCVCCQLFGSNLTISRDNVVLVAQATDAGELSLSGDATLEASLSEENKNGKLFVKQNGEVRVGFGENQTVFISDLKKSVGSNMDSLNGLTFKSPSGKRVMLVNEAVQTAHVYGNLTKLTALLGRLNSITSTTYRFAGNNGALKKIEFFDGTGKSVQSQTSLENSSAYLVKGSYFEHGGRKWREVLPFPMNTSGSFVDMANFRLLTLADEFYKKKESANGASFQYGGTPYFEYKYDYSPVQKLFKTGAPGKDFAIGSGHESYVWYFGVPSSSSFLTIDELAKKSTAYNRKENVPNVSDTYYYTNPITNEEFKRVYSELDESFDFVPTDYQYVLDFVPSPDNATHHLKVTLDPNGNWAQEISDAKGNVVSRRTYSDKSNEATTAITSYSKYDAQNRLEAEVSPLGYNEIKDANFDVSKTKFKTTYTYDNLGKVLTKKVPDRDFTELFEYDDAGRTTKIIRKELVDTVLYDAFGRPKESWTRNSGAILTRSKTWYDRTATMTDQYNTPGLNEQIAVILPTLKNLRGRTVGSVYYPTEGSEQYMNLSFVSYDAEGRTEAAYSWFPFTGWTKSASTYDLLGTVLTSKTWINYDPLNPLATPKLNIAYDYDNLGRLVKIRNVSSGNVPCVTYTYAETGEMTSKTLYNHLGSAVNTVSYKYNIRGWTTAIDAGEQLKEFLSYAGNYNGNITTAQYKYKSDGKDKYLVTDYTQLFTYDGINRLTNASAPTVVSGGSFSIDDLKKELDEVISYDADGQIKTKSRNGKNGSKGGTYVYKDNSHRLRHVSGYHPGEDNYTYDSHGNITYDASKKMKIEWDSRNMPTKFSFDQNNDGTAESEVEMVYDAGGNRVIKLERLPSGSKASLYSGSFVYEMKAPSVTNLTIKNLQADDFKLSYYTMPGGEGRVNLKDDGKTVVGSSLYLKDHLGSTRVTVDGSGKTEEADIFTAWGEELVVVEGTNTAETKEKFTGKELDRDGGYEETVNGVTIDHKGMDLNYFGARYYDPVIGYWISLDPKEQFWSGYSYTANGFNPVNAVDPDGEELFIIGDKQFTQAVQNDIASLQSGLYGKGLVNTLVESKHKFYIRQPEIGKGNSAQPTSLFAYLKIGSGGTVLYDANKMTGGKDITGSNVRPPFVGLAHELGHLLDYNYGRENPSMELNKNGIPAGEATSMKTENTVRAEHNLPERAKY